jgi:molybdopterin-guanine dinucleotide biosynthesis protein
MSFTTIAIAGVSSEVGKTTLLCELLRKFSGWEAIKMTRGHYRSCGKDPHACCVSHLLGEQPIIRSGFRETYVSDKDTGRYWDAGAANVHWVVVTNEQVEQGIELALRRVHAPGVLIEGNSFLRFIDVDFTVLVTGGADTKIKSSARWAFQKASAIYQFDQTRPRQKPDREGGPTTHLALPHGRASDTKTNQASPSETVELLNKKFGLAGLQRSLPAYATSDFPSLVKRIKQVHSSTSYVSPRLGYGLSGWEPRWFLNQLGTGGRVKGES